MTSEQYEQMEKMIKDVQEDFDSVLKHQFAYTQSFNYTPDSTKILTQWFNAKSAFIEKFYNQLIYDAGEHVFNLDPEAQLENLNNFINTLKHTYEEYDLARFLKKFRNEFFETQRTSEIYEQVVDIKNVGCRAIVIPKGMKIIKAFKYFIEDKLILEILQNKASMLIQENKIYGHLYLSVHPLDYLSLSENTNNWRSCHALDGDYCAGNLSYMCDTTTIVCYIAGEDKKELPHFGPVKWNSKKWRMLLYVSPYQNLLFAGRHYPFFSKSAMDTVKKQYAFLKHTPVMYSKWHNDVLTRANHQDPDDYNITWTNEELITANNPIMFINKYFVDINRIVKDVSDLHFNDLLKSTVYEPYYSFTTDWSPTGEGNLFVGNDVFCPYCGKRLLFNSGSLACDSCYDLFREDIENSFIVGECCNCARLVYVDEPHVYDAGGNLYCDSCRESELTQCSVCFDWIPKATMIKVNDIFASINKNINKEKKFDNVCISCAAMLKNEMKNLEEENNNG